MTGRRNLLLAASGASLAWPFFAEAQQPGKVWRIGYLSPLSSETGAPYMKAFEDRLREHGYVLGRNIIVEVRRAPAKHEDLARFATALVRLKVDVIVTGASPPTLAAIEATKTIPIVFHSVTDPVARGFVASLARPGRNVTGLAFDVDSLIAVKRLELLKEIAPSVSRIAVLEVQEPGGRAPWAAELQNAGRTLGLRLESFSVKSGEDFAEAFLAIGRRRPDALFVAPNPLSFLHWKRIADFAAEQRLPAIFAWREAGKAGALVSYGADILDLSRRAADFVDKILKGASPADIAVEQPTKFELIINLRTAKALGLTIPPSILFRADEVIE